MTTRAESLRERAAEKRKKADALVARADRQSDLNPGSFVTGASGRSRAQNRGTERALNATINAAVQASKLRKEADDLDRKAWAIEDPRIIAEIHAERKASRKKRKEKERAARRKMSLEERYFCGVNTTGLVYCDMGREKNGDFLQVARLSFSDLTVEIYEERSSLLPRILADIERVQAMKGQEYRTSGNTCVVLGWKLLENEI